MGAIGTSADNAACESFHASLKCETLQGTHRYEGTRSCRLTVFRWLTRYNTRRRHSAKGQLCPIDYEHQHQEKSATLTLAIRLVPMHFHSREGRPDEAFCCSWIRVRSETPCPGHTPRTFLTVLGESRRVDMLMFGGIYRSCVWVISRRRVGWYGGTDRGIIVFLQAALVEARRSTRVWFRARGSEERAYTAEGARRWPHRPAAQGVAGCKAFNRLRNPCTVTRSAGVSGSGLKCMRLFRNSLTS